MAINYSNIPKAIKDLPIWMLWRYEQKPDKKKPDKVPYSPNGSRAKSNDASTWSSYEVVCKAFMLGSYDGIGVGISGDIAGLDLDNCIDDDGNLSDMAQDIVSRMNCYTEYSPSGKGLRLIFKAPGHQYDRTRYYIKNDKKGLEAYIAGATNRYLTITGNVYSTAPVEERSQEVAGVLEAYMIRPSTPERLRQTSAQATSMTDLQLLDKINESAQGEQFRRLWAGDTSSHNGDDSAADMALCNILAFWTGRNTQRIDGMFRQSGLYRPKWDERRGVQTYGQLTIDRAVQDCNTVYDGGLVVHTAKADFATQSTESVPPKLVFYDAVDYVDPEFLVNPYIPLGKITILQADSGVGKTALACKIAACVSRGMPIQDTPCSKGMVLVLSVEDDPETLRGRIEASGGDLARCAFLENAHEYSFTSPAIEDTIRDYGIKLVIFDPLQAFLGAKMDMHRANETRPVMAHLAAMAKRTGCAIVIISHMSKGTAGGKAIYRALGSVDIPAASRSVLYVERNPDDDDQCVMVHTKSSNAKKGRTILYRIGDRGGVQFEGYSTLTYEDLQVQAERREKGIQYEDEPVVQVFTMFHQDNPKGAFISWEQLDNYANRILGYFPCKSGKEWNTKIKAIQRECTERSRILFEFKHGYLEEHVEFGEKVVPDTKGKARGVKVMPFKPRTEYQIGMNDNQI